MAIPRFSGVDPESWISFIESILCNSLIHPSNYVEFSLQFLDGAARDWAYTRKLQFIERGWCNFVYNLLWEFDKPYEEDLIDNTEKFADVSIPAAEVLVVESPSEPSSGSIVVSNEVNFIVSTVSKDEDDISMNDVESLILDEHEYISEVSVPDIRLKIGACVVKNVLGEHTEGDGYLVNRSFTMEHAHKESSIKRTVLQYGHSNTEQKVFDEMLETSVGRVFIVWITDNESVWNNSLSGYIQYSDTGWRMIEIKWNLQSDKHIIWEPGDKGKSAPGISSAVYANLLHIVGNSGVIKTMHHGAGTTERVHSANEEVPVEVEGSLVLAEVVSVIQQSTRSNCKNEKLEAFNVDFQYGKKTVKKLRGHSVLVHWCLEMEPAYNKIMTDHLVNQSRFAAIWRAYPEMMRKMSEDAYKDIRLHYVDEVLYMLDHWFNNMISFCRWCLSQHTGGSSVCSICLGSKIYVMVFEESCTSNDKSLLMAVSIFTREVISVIYMFHTTVTSFHWRRLLSIITICYGIILVQLLGKMCLHMIAHWALHSSCYNNVCCSQSVALQQGIRHSKSTNAIKYGEATPTANMGFTSTLFQFFLTIHWRMQVEEMLNACGECKELIRLCCSRGKTNSGCGDNCFAQVNTTAAATATSSCHIYKGLTLIPTACIALNGGERPRVIQNGTITAVGRLRVQVFIVILKAIVTTTNPSGLHRMKTRVIQANMILVPSFFRLQSELLVDNRIFNRCSVMLATSKHIYVQIYRRQFMFHMCKYTTRWIRVAEIVDSSTDISCFQIMAVCVFLGACASRVAGCICVAVHVMLKFLTEYELWKLVVKSSFLVHILSICSKSGCSMFEISIIVFGSTLHTSKAMMDIFAGLVYAQQCWHRETPELYIVHCDEDTRYKVTSKWQSTRLRILGYLHVLSSYVTCNATCDQRSCTSPSKWVVQRANWEQTGKIDSPTQKDAVMRLSKAFRGCFSFQWNLLSMLLGHRDMFYVLIAFKGDPGNDILNFHGIKGAGTVWTSIRVHQIMCKVKCGSPFASGMHQLGVWVWRITTQNFFFFLWPIACDALISYVFELFRIHVGIIISTVQQLFQASTPDYDMEKCVGMFNVGVRRIVRARVYTYPMFMAVQITYRSGHTQVPFSTALCIQCFDPGILVYDEFWDATIITLKLSDDVRLVTEVFMRVLADIDKSLSFTLLLQGRKYKATTVRKRPHGVFLLEIDGYLVVQNYSGKSQGDMGRWQGILYVNNLLRHNFSSYLPCILCYDPGIVTTYCFLDSVLLTGHIWYFDPDGEFFFSWICIGMAHQAMVLLSSLVPQWSEYTYTIISSMVVSVKI